MTPLSKIVISIFWWSSVMAEIWGSCWRHRIRNIWSRREFGSILYRSVWGWSIFIGIRSCIEISRLWIFFSIKMIRLRLVIWELPRWWIVMILRIPWLVPLSIFRRSFARRSLITKKVIFGPLGAYCMSYVHSGIRLRLLIRLLSSWKLSVASILYSFI